MVQNDKYQGTSAIFPRKHSWNSSDGNSLTVQWLGLCTSARGRGPIPGQGTKVLQATPQKIPWNKQMKTSLHVVKQITASKNGRVRKFIKNLDEKWWLIINLELRKWWKTILLVKEQKM